MRSPRGAQASLRVSEWFTPLSSTNQSRERCQRRRRCAKRSRATTTSGRVLSQAWRVFFFASGQAVAGFATLLFRSATPVLSARTVEKALPKLHRDAPLRACEASLPLSPAPTAPSLVPFQVRQPLSAEPDSEASERSWRLRRIASQPEAMTDLPPTLSVFACANPARSTTCSSSIMCHVSWKGADDVRPTAATAWNTELDRDRFE